MKDITLQELRAIVDGKLIDRTEKRSYEDLSELIFGEGNCYNDSEVRKRMYGMKRVFEIIDKDKQSLCNDTQQKELDKKLEAIRKERIKLQTANVERNRIDKNEARQEMFYEYIGSVITSLPLPEFHPLFNDCEIKDIEYALTLSDLHFGASFISENNEYSKEICKKRLEYLIAYMIDFIEEKEIQHLHIFCLGDVLQGILRVSDLKLNDSSIVKATVEISRLLAQFLNELSAYANIHYYHVGAANHTQLRLLGTKASELGDEDLEYVIGNYIMDLCRNNERISVNLPKDGTQYIETNINGNRIIAMHGHTLKSLSSAQKDLSMLKNEVIDYLLVGHFHASKSIPIAEGCTYDIETLVAPSFVGSCPYSDSIMKGSKAASKIYGFDSVYGNTETYKVILN